MYSSALDHIFCNKSLVQYVYSQSLPTITLVNGIQTTPTKGVGKLKLMSFVTLNFVLQVPDYPFNLASVSHATRALHCAITSFDDFFLMQDHSTGQTIGTRHESQGLYYLTSKLLHSISVTNPPDLIHKCLGHPSLSKLQKIVPSLSSLSILD